MLLQAAPYVSTEYIIKSASLAEIQEVNRAFECMQEGNQPRLQQSKELLLFSLALRGEQHHCEKLKK